MNDWMMGGVVENDAEEARTERLWGPDYDDDPHDGHDCDAMAEAQAIDWAEHLEEELGPVPPTDEDRDIEDQLWRLTG